MSKKTIALRVALLLFALLWLLTVVSNDFHLIIYILAIGTFYLVLDNDLLNTVFNKSLSVEQRAILLEFKYYMELSPLQKLEFETRVQHLVNNKNFLGKKELVVTERMKVLISATIAQIGFGYSFVALENFEKIIIYPKAYYSRYSQRYHKGEVSSLGVIVLSWKDFLEGFTISDDGFNVGLHEVAHAFQIEDVIPNSEYHYLQDVDLKRWNAVSKIEFNKIRQGIPSFIRSYAGTNRQEFFAVCVEQFFEQSESFQTQLPDLYRALAKLLRQDPLKRKNQQII